MAINTATFKFAEDIGEWSRRTLGDHFLAWFNANLPSTSPWEGVRLIDTPQNRLGFHAFWNNIREVTGSTATPFQFLCLMSIFANECRADFTPKAERMGRAGFPGLSYLFDAIPSLKRSYNTLSGNKRAFDCFNSGAFNATHGGKPMANRTRNTSDARWRGEVYPRPDFSTGLWSTRMTWKGCFRWAVARTVRNFPGISAAVSMPVSPAPTITTL